MKTGLSIICLRTTAQFECSFSQTLPCFVTNLRTLIYKKSIPIVVVDGTVLVATIGATVAAATGVTGLKMGFCGEQKIRTII